MFNFSFTPNIATFNGIGIPYVFSVSGAQPNATVTMMTNPVMSGVPSGGGIGTTDGNGNFTMNGYYYTPGAITVSVTVGTDGPYTTNVQVVMPNATTPIAAGNTIAIAPVATSTNPTNTVATNTVVPVTTSVMNQTGANTQVNNTNTTAGQAIASQGTTNSAQTSGYFSIYGALGINDPELGSLPVGTYTALTLVAAIALLMTISGGEKHHRGGQE